MPFTSYLPEKYSYTHENQIFRTISNQLLDKYKNHKSQVVFIGNISCNGHHLDALFIKSGQITIIDFKNYGGTLTFSEQNPWSIVNIYDNKGKKEEKTTIVAGGNNIRNPYMQVFAYKNSLDDLLKQNINLFTENNHSNLNLRHISTMVLFHQKINFDNNSVPIEIQKFLFITDIYNYINVLNDINSDKLILSDVEINNIINILNLKEENLYDYSEIEKVETHQNNLLLRRSLIDRLLLNTDTDIFKNILNYAHTILNLESYIETDIKSKQIFNIDVDANLFNKDNYELDFSQAKNIKTNFDDNFIKNFPENIFYGIVFKINKEERILLHNFILANELKKDNYIYSISLKDLILFPKTFYDLGLEDNQIEDLNFELEKKNNLNEKIDFLLQYFQAFGISLENKIAITFTSQNLANIKLLSEIKRLRDTTIFNDILKNFLIYNTIDNKNSTDNIFKIRISNLNNSQENSVYNSFLQNLTVITGPPGTGKTQVVLNIIANALINDKKILFASKNNKAVNNVKERFENLLKYDFINRIGSKTENKIQIEKLEKLINQINNQEFSDKTTELNALKLEINELNGEYNELKYKLERINILSSQLTEINHKISILNHELNQYLNTLSADEKTFFVDKKLNINIIHSEFEYFIYKVNSYNSNFIKKIIFKLFHQNKYIDTLFNYNKEIPLEIKNYIDGIYSLFVNYKTDINRIIKYSDEVIKIIKISQNIKGVLSDFNNKINLLKINIDETKKELANLIALKPEIEIRIKEIDNILKDKGIEFINSFITDRLFRIPVSIIQDYMNALNSSPKTHPEFIEFEENCKHFIEYFPALLVTNLSVNSGFPLISKSFDYLVIDEASQCDILSAIPLIYRAKKVIIIGDDLQLKHITSIKKQENEYVLNHYKLNDNKFNYTENSLFDYSNSLANHSNITTYFLNEHFRCHPDIINFSNIHFYQKQKGNSLEIKTINTDFKIGDLGIHWLDVKGEVDSYRNVNIKEIEKCEELFKTLYEKFPDAEFGITTPFRDQADMLRKKFSGLKNVSADTIHKFQGDEKDIIILSLVVSDKSKDGLKWFINEGASYLLNVAVTRAKSTLYIVGNSEYCRKAGGYLKKLIQHTEQFGKIIN